MKYGKGDIRVGMALVGRLHEHRAVKIAGDVVTFDSYHIDGPKYNTFTATTGQSLAMMNGTGEYKPFGARRLFEVRMPAEADPC